MESVITNEHGLTETLKMAAEHKGFGLWRAIYRKGHAGVVGPFSKEERKELRVLVAKTPCQVGFCYMNAQQIAIRALGDMRLKYMEGLVTVCGVPLDHAWIEYNGKVFDPTLCDMKTFKPKSRREVGEYYGMEVPKRLIIKHQLRVKTYSPLIQWPSEFAEQLLEGVGNADDATKA